MKSLIKFVILLLLSTNQTYALTANEARNSALSFGESINQNNSQVISDKTAKLVPAYNENPPQAEYYSNQTNIKSDTTKKIEDSAIGKLLTKEIRNRPVVDVKLTDPFLTKSQFIEKNPDQVTKMMMDSYADCRPIMNNSNIEEKTKYFCNSKKTNYSQICDQILKMECVKECNSNQLKTFSNNVAPNFTIFIPRQPGSCSIYSKNFNFTIEDVSAIKEFTLTHLEYDDFASVKINGVTLFNDIPASIRRCERSTTFNQNPNISLIPYLVNGNNQIEVKVLVKGMGQVYADFVVSQKCCENWQENWQEVCYEN